MATETNTQTPTPTNTQKKFTPPKGFDDFVRLLNATEPPNPNYYLKRRLKTRKAINE